jgi:hypothetical protein
MGVGLGFPVVAKMGARRGLPPDRRGVRGRSRAPIFTQRAVDMIANGTAGRQLVWLGFGAIAAVGIEAALTSVRQSLVMRLISLLNGRISRKAFMHLMRMRIDLGVFLPGRRRPQPVPAGRQDPAIRVGAGATGCLRHR